MQKDFNSSLKLGSMAEEIVEALLTKQSRTFKRTEHTEYQRLNLSFESDYYLKDENLFIEVKCLAGGYNTFCIEKYKNIENPLWNPTKGHYMNLNNQKDVKYPGWMRTILAGQNLNIYIINRKESAVYIYDGEKMYNFIQKYPDGGLSQALDGNSVSTGWIAKIEWCCKEAGFINKISYNKRSA